MNLEPHEQIEVQDEPRSGLQRRSFLKAAGALVFGLSACSVPTTRKLSGTVAPESSLPVPQDAQYDPVPSTPNRPPEDGVFFVFTPHEASTVEALTARILPGTPEDPGAREAGVVYYIDRMLAYREGLNEATYRKPPYAQTYRGSQPPAVRGPSKTLWVPEGEIMRYGYQSILTPRDVYRIGLSGVDRYAQQLYGRDFTELAEEQQDRLVGDMADGNAPDFDRNLPASSFFHNLRRHTAEGMFSDPVYGGNRGMVGWKLVGYPGAQRAYTPAELQTEGSTRTPQTLTQLHPFNPGQPANDHVTLPVSGENMQHH